MGGIDGCVLIYFDLRADWPCDIYFTRETRELES